MTYEYSYSTESAFTPSVGWHFFKLRVIPCTNEFQQVSQKQLTLTPHCRVMHSIDGQGNAVQWGTLSEVHDKFCVQTQGAVTQIRLYAIHEVPAPYYLTPTRLTAWNEDLLHVARNIVETRGFDQQQQQHVFEIAADLMHFVHNYLTYSPGHTTISTTALDAYQDPQGVCQDYAHLLIALCRSLGIHARYANGLIAGEGQTHAWVEVSDGQVWLPFDPTHNLAPQWGYVKFAHGRDADDCPTNRGRFYCWTSEQQQVLCRLTT